MLHIPHEDEELSVNITSLIDVIFILLIFFMVSTQFKKNALPLDLPQSADTTEQESSAKVLAVTESRLELDGKPVADDELMPLLSALYTKQPDLSLSLECEKTVDFERVVQVLTKIQAAGITRIGIVHETVD
ncbi:MAG: biopolymer transporter ExbD [Treponema sp.]|nr:biopolymer transporter ExbD [Treponema sp.]